MGPVKPVNAKFAGQTLTQINLFRFDGGGTAGQKTLLPAIACQRGEPGQPRTIGEQAAIVILKQGHMLPQGRTRTDETHVSSQDIPQLRQLIEAAAAQPKPQRRHPAKGAAPAGTGQGGAGLHRAELDQ